MKTFLGKIFGPHLDFRTQLFNLMHVTGAITSTLMAALCVVIPWRTLSDAAWLMSITVGVIALLWYAKKSGNYRVIAIVTTIFVFSIILPAIYLTGIGGYRGGVVFFFIFCVMFTVSMLKGKPMAVMIVLELAAYISVCFLDFFNPGLVRPFEHEWQAFAEVVVCFIIVCVILAFVLTLYIRLYDEQQRKLEAARRQAEEFLRTKSDLFTKICHEMRTPLTVMSSYAQCAAEQIKEGGGINEDTLADISSIRDEAERLAELVNGTLGVLKNFGGDAGGDVCRGDRPGRPLF